MIDRVIYKDLILAIIVRKNINLNYGTEFITDESDLFQLGLIKRNEGEVIKKHYHLNQKRNINKTTEALIVKKGKVEITFFHEEKIVTKKIIERHDIAILFDGGHSFKFYEDSEMVEIKQGPYIKDKDKIY